MKRTALAAVDGFPCPTCRLLSLDPQHLRNRSANGQRKSLAPGDSQGTYGRSSLAALILAMYTKIPDRCKPDREYVVRHHDCDLIALKLC